MTQEEYREFWSRSTDVPYGTCWCGCGLETPFATKTRVERFHYVGLPVRYLHGHGGRRTEPVDGKLTCRRCSESKSVSEFYENGHRKNTPHARKYQTICKRCIRDQALQYKYKLTLDEYEQRVVDQSGRCAICGNETVLVVDHDHETGNVRQLLCDICNRGLGFFDDDPQLLRQAARYVAAKTHPVLDKGYVELVDVMASDLNVVNSARVSFNTAHQFLEPGDEKLIQFLMRERHGTPFESSVFTFRIKAPIFVAREWFRHRIGSFNEWSGRYSKLEAEFYIPFPENVRSQIGKPGAYTFSTVSEDATDYTIEALIDSYDESWKTYEKLLALGIAKELARVVLPVGIYTQFYWTVNARALMNFLSLRNADTALFEIHEYAKVIEEIASSLMPITFKAFMEHGHIAP